MEQEPLTAEQLKIYDRSTCQKCEQPISIKRLENCKSRHFFPVCESCEKIIVPKLIEARKKMAAMQKGKF